jgi:hypothetical protein
MLQGRPCRQPGSPTPQVPLSVAHFVARFVCQVPSIFFARWLLLGPNFGERRKGEVPRITLSRTRVSSSPRGQNSVRVSGAMLAEVRDGKIVGEWSYWDQLSLLARLGITEQPGLFLSPEGF